MTNFEKIFFITIFFFILFLPYVVDGLEYCKFGGCAGAPLTCNRPTCINGDTCYYSPNSCLPPTYSTCVYDFADSNPPSCPDKCIGNTWYYNGSATSYNTATLNLSSANFGNQWKCLVRDSNQCGVFTNELTIT